MLEGEKTCSRQILTFLVSCYHFYQFLIMTIDTVTEALEMDEPISVAIGGMVSPSSFWVYPLPNLDAPEDQSINKVLQLEEVGLRTESSCPH